MKYYPDSFKIVKLEHEEEGIHHRILAGWYGGYGGSDSWKLSSGIVSIKDNDKFWEVPNSSGSIYYLNKDSERFSMYTQSIYNNFKQNEVEVKLSLVDIKDILEKYPHE